MELREVTRRLLGPDAHPGSECKAGEDAHRNASCALARFGVDDQCMTQSNRLDTFVRAVVAVATSVFTGATAGALLARKPLAVSVDQRRRYPSGR